MDIHKSEESTPLTTDPKAQEFRDNTLRFKEEYESLCQKYGMQYKIIVDFPQYNILPDEVLLAMKVIQKNGGQFVMRIAPLEKIEETEKKEGES